MRTLITGNYHRSLLRTCTAALTASAIVFGVVSASNAATPVRVENRVILTDKDVQSDPGVPPYSKWRARSVTLKHPKLDLATLRAQADAGATVPFWTANIVSPLDSNTYTMSMIGGNPMTSTSNTAVTYVPIVVKFSFRHGVTLDPTKHGCGDTVPVSTRFWDSLLFMPVSMTSNGQNVSLPASQFSGSFQRANFWSLVSGNNYNFTLTASGSPIVITENAPAGSTVSTIHLACGTVSLGEIPINAYDALIQKIIKKYATPSELPVILTYNVVETEGGCCIIGYHNAIPVPAGTQTYAVGAYVDPGIFGTAFADMYSWSHEMDEWLDDPFVQASVPGGYPDDLTPAWGNVGQVSGCQNNLEVGDPLTGTNFSMVGYGGFLYHFQDLAFHDWFYRTPASGAGSEYSFQGTFTSTQGACT